MKKDVGEPIMTETNDLNGKIEEWTKQNSETFNKIEDLGKIRLFLADKVIERLCFIRICQTGFTRVAYMKDFLASQGYTPLKNNLYRSLNRLRTHSLVNHIEISCIAHPKTEMEAKIKEYFDGWQKYLSKNETAFLIKHAGFFYVSDFAKQHHLDLFALVQSGIISREDYEKKTGEKFIFEAERIIKDWKEIL